MGYLKDNDSGSIIKKDDGKPKWTLLSGPALEEMIKVMEHGSNKDGREEGDWKKGTLWSRYANSLIRHWVRWWWYKENIDSDSGCHHLAHVACNAMILIHWDLFKSGQDDRQENSL
jgi:hypothetical protein